MRKLIIHGIAMLMLLTWSHVYAQTASSSDYLKAQPIADRTVPFAISDLGESKPITWGLDLAWLSEGNIRRGIAFMEQQNVDIVRSSFTPTAALINGDLPQAELDIVNQRINIISTWLGNMPLTLNCDHPSVSDWYKNADGTTNAYRWAQLIDVTATHHKNAGHSIVTVSPFNEPDYGWGQGDMADFYNIAGEIRQSFSTLDGVRISGGNTLSTDAGVTWYNYLSDRLDEGNTHQLAGSFDNYATLHQSIQANGDHGTNDELHNVMEAMVGAEYGMQTGIWWGTANYARGEFVQASDGTRLGYAEHRPNWSAASVYRNTDGEIQAFAGQSERQAITTTFRFVSKERDVYYDGLGPQREFVLEMPGGTAYWENTPNAERVINITWGDDIQPVINGTYTLVNRSNGNVIQINGGSSTAGANLEAGSSTGATNQQWNVIPVDARIGGDFSYFTINNAQNNLAPDIYNYSLDNGGNIVVWDDTQGENQQWYLEYAEDGWFYIRSRFNAKCLQINGSNVEQWDKTGNAAQQWRLIPAGAPIEFTAPSAPSSLSTVANNASVRLDWTASSSSDVAGYHIYRADSPSAPFNTIAQNVNGTTFVDNTALEGNNYYYSVKAIDQSLNRSNYSNTVTGSTSAQDGLVAHYTFDNNTQDISSNLNHAATFGTANASGTIGGAIGLDGSDDFLQLPVNVTSSAEITIATWVYWNGGGAWQRIFDFGNDQSEYLFLTPSAGSGELRFAIKDGGAEQVLNAPALSTGTWNHVAITLSGNIAKMYLNGQLVDESSSFSISPDDFKPIANYIGRSQYPDPLFNGRIDDFRIYNHELSAFDIAVLGTSSSNYYQLRNRNTGLYLDGMGRTTNGADCGQYANTSDPNAQWELIPVDQNYYKLQNRGTGLLLDGMGRTTNGDACGQYEDTGSQNAHWALQQYDGIYYRVQNRATGLYLDGYGYTTNGANVNQYANTGHVNAQWELVTVPNTARVEELLNTVEKQADIKLFPNPTNDLLNIQLKNEGNNTVSIRNLSGKEVLNKQLKAGENQLSIQHLKAGIYMVTIQGEVSKTYRIIKE
ncbi:RICIN domain-containing protein [Marinoscillum pacificum]|uniref:RICIN domain-containing protein n=1 Tax=Marinoscillum pacificum TaxID=392723 RepID=UPI0021576E61|nr:RICIN domain-containing protein [Marinoscillum pacificum]